MQGFTAFFTSILIFIGSVFSVFLPRVPAPVPEQQLIESAQLFSKKELSDTVYEIDLGLFTQDERYSAIALQGIVAKTNPCIYLRFGGMYNKYLDTARAQGKTVISTDKDGNRWTYKALIREFASYIKDGGYVLYRNSEFAEGLNVATNFATAYSWLPVCESAEDAAIECGLTLKKDISKEQYDYSFQRRYFRELKNNFVRGGVVHVKMNNMGLRDLAISQGMFCFYCADNGFAEPGNSFMKEVLRWSGENTAVYGWCELEKETVRLISDMGGCLIASDYCYNCSYLSQLESANNFAPRTPTAYNDESKHYITLVFSDGDNCQWIQNGFPEYHTTMANYPDLNISWTYSPTMGALCPPATDSTLSSAGSDTCFVCGPSGYGYCNPSRMSTKALDAFSTQTAGLMLENNQRIITILDDYSAINEAKIARSTGFFSRFDNIDGGILFLDPSKYESGKGKVWFADDKPFVSVRMSLWADDGYDGATDEWLIEQAERINSLPADIGSIDGYSAICIHAWSMKPEAINKFISMLDDHIEVLAADDFIATLAQNIPHETAAPGSSSVIC